MTSKRYDLTIRFFWLALGLFVVVYSYTLGLGKLIDPGPGLLPFLLGLIFLILSSVRLVTVIRLRETDETEEEKKKTEYWRIVLIVVALLIWAFILESLGFLIATFILMTLLYHAAGFKKWYLAVFWGLITVLVTYFVFTYLGVRFPPGILRTLGIG
jgi:putative tricarboxylic transport membrane protein